MNMALNTYRFDTWDPYCLRCAICDLCAEVADEILQQGLRTSKSFDEVYSIIRLLKQRSLPNEEKKYIIDTLTWIFAASDNAHDKALYLSIALRQLSWELERASADGCQCAIVAIVSIYDEPWTFCSLASQSYVLNRLDAKR